jgi:hypothetical protein
MYLVQLIIPLHDNQKRSFSREQHDLLRDELTSEFGGVTAFVNSPALGVWDEGKSKITLDEVIVFEVMVDALDREWWRNYRTTLETRFKQKEILIRAIEMEQL